MSFGFSVGDFLAGAQLAYTLVQSLSTAKGSAQEYQELMTELKVVHKVLIQVDQLRAANHLAQATTTSLLFTVASTIDAMESFLATYESYSVSLQGDGSGNVFKDAWKKGSWALQMPNRVSKLRRTLSTMLASINCLVTLACYFNSGYDPRCEMGFVNSVTNPDDENWKFDDVKIEGVLIYDSTNNRDSPDRFARNWDEQKPSLFERQKDKEKFFRPGQVFALRISSQFWFKNKRSWRHVDYSRLSLDPISTLQKRADSEATEDRQKRLAQLLRLPLRKMIPYSVETLFDRKKVYCRLCWRLSEEPPSESDQWMTKDEWASSHFRYSHWRNYYRPMAGVSMFDETREKNPQPSLVLPELEAEFETGAWIRLEDVASEAPLASDADMQKFVLHCSPSDPYSRNNIGPALIRRFVVVRSGENCSLCIGIHTYGGRGCGGQTDPQLHAILHSTKEVPDANPDEKGMVLPPIRMKPEHPSTALRRSARIHFGRAYIVGHEYEVLPLGQIHAGSMEDLLSKFDSNVARTTSNSTEDAEMKLNDEDVQPANIEVVRDMRRQIVNALGSYIDITDFPDPIVDD